MSTQAVETIISAREQIKALFNQAVEDETQRCADIALKEYAYWRDCGDPDPGFIVTGASGAAANILCSIVAPGSVMAKSGGIQPDSKNSEQLAGFIQFCILHPEQRFWQALRNWSEMSAIYATHDKPADVSVGDANSLMDTFAWTGRTEEHELNRWADDGGPA